MTPAAPPFPDWVADTQATHRNAADLDDLIEVRAVALYRVLHLMECGGRRADREQACASLRNWLGLT